MKKVFIVLFLLLAIHSTSFAQMIVNPYTGQPAGYIVYPNRGVQPTAVPTSDAQAIYQQGADSVRNSGYVSTVMNPDVVIGGLQTRSSFFLTLLALSFIGNVILFILFIKSRIR